MRRVVLCGLVGAAACGGEETYAFPEGLEPYEETGAAWPSARAEAVNTASGEAEGYAWVHARGYVHAGVEDTYTCLREDMVNVDRREAASWEVVEDVEEGYEHSYRIDNFIENIIDVEFSDTWRHGSTLDGDGEVVFINSRWKMTEASCCIDLREGSIVTVPTEDGATSVEIVGHLDAPYGEDTESMGSYIADFYADLLACAHDEPYATFD